MAHAAHPGGGGVFPLHAPSAGRGSRAFRSARALEPHAPGQKPRRGMVEAGAPPRGPLLPLPDGGATAAGVAHPRGQAPRRRRDGGARRLRVDDGRGPEAESNHPRAAGDPDADRSLARRSRRPRGLLGRGLHPVSLDPRLQRGKDVPALPHHRSDSGAGNGDRAGDRGRGRCLRSDGEEVQSPRADHRRRGP